MEMIEKLESLSGENPHKNKIHKVLAHSYLLYFILFLIGILLDFLFPLFIFGGYDLSYSGFVCLVIGTTLITWAQKVSTNINKENITKETFCKGPYCFTKSPTHIGLFLLMIGFALVMNAFFIFFFSILALILTKVFFLRKEEQILSEKYGAPYIEYKNSVKF